MQHFRHSVGHLQHRQQGLGEIEPEMDVVDLESDDNGTEAQDSEPWEEDHIDVDLNVKEEPESEEEDEPGHHDHDLA